MHRPAPRPTAIDERATGVTLITAPGGHSLVVDAFMSVSLGERAVGDHALVTCKVLETTCDGERRPLVFFGGAFGSFAA